MIGRLRRRVDTSGVDTTTTIGSVTLPSPVMTAAGTAGHGAELSAYNDLSALGAVVVKSLSPYPWAGNAPVRVHATWAGMINSVGLQGPGVEGWRRDELPALLDAGARVVVSIWGRSIEDYAHAARQLANLPDGVVAVEVNISCPNTDHGNQLFAHDPQMTRDVLEATASLEVPRWAKLSPNVGPGLIEIAEASLEAGAEALTLSNTYFGLSIDPRTRRPHLGRGAGGVSGRAIHPLAVKAVYDVHMALPEAPIVAAGGVATVDDVVEFALVGAVGVQIGTATLADPATVGRVTTDLERWCASIGPRRFDDLVGAVEMP